MNLHEQQIIWHAAEEDQMLRQLDANPHGLTSDQAQTRLLQHGHNTLEAEAATGPLKLLIRQLHSPLIYLLAGAAAISLATGHSFDAIVIVGVIVLNSVLGFVQEWRAEGALAALREMSAPHAKVIRDAREQVIEASHVVPGDLLLLETGDRVAADARLLRSDDLQVDESALTGESQPVAKRPGRQDPDEAMADRDNMAWMSTAVTGGRGRAIVVETGMNTQIGRIAGEVRSTEREQTPLQKRMSRLGTLLGIGGVALAVVVYFLGILRGYGYLEMLLFAVAVAVSAIPEGLPAVISVTLALGVQRMARQNAILRRLPAVETLGSTTVICTDKTGTITRNQMTVQKLYAAGRLFNVTGEGYDPHGNILDENRNPLDHIPTDLQTLLTLGMLANNARLAQADGRWTVEGNPSDGGLLVAAVKAHLDRDELLNRAPRIFEIPFSSDAKYMAALHAPHDAPPIAYAKGAPERILSYCTHALIDGQSVELDDAARARIAQLNEDLAADALRVMAGAFRHMPTGTDSITRDDVQSGLTFVGLWGMMDPPREESAAAVAEARQAGIRPIMLTGDHAATAVAIARAVHITDKHHALTGHDAERMGKLELADQAMDVGVFARVSPAHKLKILESLKEKGHIVAMTGDGVNDAPALKGADIGIAMGKSGTEVAKEAADMVLTDDNFSTIVHAIEQGRVIYNNLRRVVFFLLTTNLGEVLTLAAALAINLPLPLTAIMILWINLVTDGACTVPLGVEPMHRDVLKYPPRRPGSSILDKAMLRGILLLSPLIAIGTLGMFVWFWRSDENQLPLARTVAFTTLAAFEWFRAVSTRSTRSSVFSIGLFTNPWLLLGVGVAVILQVLAVHTSFGHTIFGTVSLTFYQWLAIILVSSTIWILDEVLKLFGIHDPLPETRRPELVH